MAVLELRTLGDCTIQVGDQRIGPQSPFIFALTLYLAVERGRNHPRDALIPLFFPDTPGENASHSLRQHVYKMRHMGVPVKTTPTGYLIAAADVRDDYTALLTTDELPHLEGERLPGEFLPGYRPKMSDELTQWLEGQRDSIRSALRRAYVARIFDRKAVARWDQVERYARACIEIDPLNEKATMALAEALALSGAKVAGQRVLDQYMTEVGEDRRLQLPASALKRRISEVISRVRQNAHAPLLGREMDIRLLNSVLEEASARQPASVFVTGDPGVGKSRLCAEFLAVAALGGAITARLACQPHDVAVPLYGLVRITRQLLSAPGALGCSPAALTILQQTCGELNAASEANGLPDLTRRVTDAFIDLADAISSEQPIVLVVDDAQWLDAASMSALDCAVECNTNLRLLTVIVLRSHAALSDGTLGRRRVGIHLRSLTREHSASLLRLHLAAGGVTADDDVVAAAWEATGGHPFHTAVWAAHYIETRDTGAASSHITSLVRQRLNTLPVNARLLLVWCALLGRHATLERLASLHGSPWHDLLMVIRVCEEGGFLVSEADRPQLAHRLLQDALIDLEPPLTLHVARLAVADMLSKAARVTADDSLYWAAANLYVQADQKPAAIALIAECARMATDCGRLATVVGAVEYISALSGDAEAAAHLYNELRDRATVLLCGWRPESDVPNLVSLPEMKTSPHAVDATILQIDRRFAAKGIRDVDVQWLKSVLTDDSLPELERVRAGAALISAADSINDRTLAHRVAESVFPLLDRVGDDPTAIRFRLSYEGTFGSSGSAKALANERIRIAERMPLERKLRELNNIAVTLQRCDSSGLDVRIFSECAEIARQLGNTPALCGLESHLAFLSWRRKDTSAQSYWLSGANASLLEIKSNTNGFHLISALIAIQAGDAEATARHADALRCTAGGDVGTAFWAYNSLIATELRLLRSEAPIPELVGRLGQWCLRGADTRPEDEVATTVHRATKAIGGTAAASRFLKDYMRRRRADAALSFCVEEIA